MERKLDLIREISLYIEKDKSWPQYIGNIEIEGYDKNDIDYHTYLMFKAGLIDGIDLSNRNGPSIAVLQLSWDGHEFLANSKNPTNWEKLKKAIGLIGDASFDIAKASLASMAGASVAIAVNSS